MAYVGSLVSHHLVSIVVALLELGFVASILGQRRPTGSTAAWLLAVVLLPYVGIPLYLVFGGRKFVRRALTKSTLALPDGLPQVAARIEWLDDGTRAYEAFLAEILGARRTIRIVTFVVGDDATGRSLLEALVRRASEGIEVRLLLDDLLRFRAPRALLSQLVAAGGRVERFMPLLHLPFRGRNNLRDHRKIAVFDGERAIVGGMNLADEYMGPGPSPTRWRDLSILVSGGPVATLDRVFSADWEFASRERLAPAAAIVPAGTGVPLTILPSGPDSATDAIYDAILTAIFRAERRFWIATPYFVPDEPLARALSVAARRGVDVRVVVPRRSNHLLADLAAAPYLRELAADGVSVFLHPRMVHAKALLADDALAVVGSANFDMRSLFLDYEIALMLSGPPEVARLGGWFDETFKDAAKGPPAAGRARRRVEGVVRLLSPLI